MKADFIRLLSKGSVMKFWSYSTLAVLAGAAVLSCASCRRAPKPAPPVPVPPVSVSPVSAPSVPTVSGGSNVIAAARAMREAESKWLASSPAAAAAFQRMTDAQKNYEEMVGKLALASAPTRERNAKMQAMIDARKKGDAALAEQAEKELAAANVKVEEGEAMVRLGNPSIQKAYDDWLAARKDYNELRSRNEAISKASDEMTRLIEKRSHLDQDRNARVKEN